VSNFVGLIVNREIIEVGDNATKPGAGTHGKVKAINPVSEAWRVEFEDGDVYEIPAGMCIVHRKGE